MPRRTAAPLALLAAGVLLLAAPPAPAQEAVVGQPEEFKTADGVLLKGRFYPASKAGQSAGEQPAVILLYSPGVGKDMSKGDWATLADKLAKEGYNVLQFDWRGHGQSTTITDTNKFWGVPLPGEAFPNTLTGPIHQKANYIRGGYTPRKLKSELRVADFGPGYFPVLVNDIAAARQHLDAKNDRHTANTSRVYLVGEGEAATLGMLWMAAEWERHDTNVLKANPNIVYMTVPPPLGTPALAGKAGEDIKGAVWLSPKLCRGVQLGQLLALYDPRRNPLLRQIPMCFVYADGDVEGKRNADLFHDRVVQAAPPKTGSLQPAKNTVRAVIEKEKSTPLTNAVVLNRVVAYMTQYLPPSKTESKTKDFTVPYYIDLGYFNFRF